MTHITRSITTMLLSLAGMMAFAQVSEWNRRADIGWYEADAPTSRSDAAAFSLNGLGYVAGGTVDDGEDVWRFDPVDESWTRVGDMPNSRQSAAAFTIGNKAYVFGGVAMEDGNFVETSDLLEYDPVQDTWTYKTPMPGPGRKGAVAFSIAGKGYVATGMIAGECVVDLWEYDPVADTWTAKADLPADPLSHSTAFVAGGKGHVVTGRINCVNSYSNQCWAYDPGTDTWEEKATMPGAVRAYAQSFAIGNVGYVAGGGGGSYLQDMWSYDPVVDEWTQLANLGGGGRRSGMAFVINGTGYLGLGANTYQKPDVWAFDPVANTWTETAMLGVIGRDYHSSFTIGSKGYITCGTRINNYHFNDLWEYDPGTDAWSQRADLPGPARRAATAFAIGNTGYVTTGWNGVTQYDDLWAYDAITNTWTEKAPFPGVPRRGALSFVIDGQGYVGQGGSPALQFDTWRYDPQTDTWLARADAAIGWYGAAVVHEGQAYGLFGNYETIMRYDPVADEWEELDELGELMWDLYAQDQLRYTSSHFKIGNVAYFVYGEYLGSVVNNVLALDLTDLSFEVLPAPDFPNLVNSTGFGIGNNGYVCGGSTTQTGALPYLWEFTPDITTQVTPVAQGPAAPLAFPSPTAGLLTLVRSEADEPLQLVVRDALGSILMRGTWAGGSTTHTIDLSALATGVYFVELTGRKGSTVQRVVRGH